MFTGYRDSRILVLRVKLSGDAVMNIVKCTHCEETCDLDDDDLESPMGNCNFWDCYECKHWFCFTCTCSCGTWELIHVNEILAEAMLSLKSPIGGRTLVVVEIADWGGAYDDEGDYVRGEAHQTKDMFILAVLGRNDLFGGPYDESNYGCGLNRRLSPVDYAAWRGALLRAVEDGEGGYISDDLSSSCSITEFKTKWGWFSASVFDYVSVAVAA
jgi:hypothetical protein